MIKRLFSVFKSIIPSTAKTCWWMLRLTLCVSFVVFLLDYVQWLPVISKALHPLFAWIGLPGEASLAYVSGYFVNVYSAIAVAVTLDLGPRAMTIMGVLVLCSHNMFVETGIQHKTGTPWWVMVIVRTLSGLLLAWCLHQVLPSDNGGLRVEQMSASATPAITTETISGTASLPTASFSAVGSAISSATGSAISSAAGSASSPVAAATAAAPATAPSVAPVALSPAATTIAAAATSFGAAFLDWLKSALGLALKMIALIFGLNFLQRVLAEFGVTQWLSRAFRPLMTLFGLPDRCSFLWIVANTLGLAYGGAVMLEEVERGGLSRHDINLLNLHIGVSHSNLEDLLLFSSIGAVGWILLLARWLMSIILVWSYLFLCFIRNKYLSLRVDSV